MFSKFQNELEQNFLYLKSGKNLLAISGGLDSVSLAYLSKKAGLDFALAHCNFNLRDEESEADEAFVKQLARELKVKVFVQHFDTHKFAEEHKVSIQMAARELRYNWFMELKKQLTFDYILTAHHANDDLETFLINLSRGTGLNGLTGISENQNEIVRPLLNFSRSEIEAFAESENLKWREDSSNASTKYIRNKIRHQIVPLFEEINPQFLKVFQETQEHLAQSAALLEDYTAILFKEIVSKKGEAYFFDLQKIKKAPNPQAVLYQLLNGFGFTAWQDIYDLLQSQSGKKIFSESHRLVKDREHLILTTISSEAHPPEFFVSEKEEFIELPFGNLKFEEVENIAETNENVAYLDKEKLQFPLKIRKWRAGDSFYPFGMKGSKKLSDFFINKKLSLPEKENVWMLFSENKIVWIINHRIDDRFKVEEHSRHIVKVTYTP